ncbi:MAG TPA: HypC/HybG/HupF family hydrogenase formation chaperone [Nitrososphaeria archaeon]|nr:MAG: HypC/HybG/HupF family hydrogenase formation chaperone [Nitrososphaerota archaeon]HDD42776.1 HypC/HybG/HupF family hydrogenase formation chaperone [Nitrososphaeria archaeon]
MCYAVPGKVVEVKGDIGVVDFGNGVRREVMLAMVDADVGDYVLVHAGYAIKVLDEKSALEILKEFEEVLRLSREGA